MNLKEEIDEIGRRAKESSLVLAKSSEEIRNKALSFISQGIENNISEIISENKKDLKVGEEKGLSSSLLDRLTLDEKRIRRMVDSLMAVIKLPDPLGRILWQTERPNGLIIKKVSVPIGVIGIIYESRPDVTVEASSLCFKSGNAVVLKGGSESLYSNSLLTEIIQEGIGQTGLPKEAVQLIRSKEHLAVDYLLSLDQYLNLIIPRGGEALIEKVVSRSRIPVIKHYKGICHIYIDKEADLEMAINVAYNSKVQRPATCNATETLLVHKNIAQKFLPSFFQKLKEAGVEVRGCPETRKIIPEAREAKEADWSTEYLDLILSIKIVNSLDEAITHINRYGTEHSEAIITKDKERGERFLKEVDAAAVYLNASTRFTDGYEFGLGAEIGISTDKIHARGPMGLNELTSYKYIVFGNGQIRE